MYVPILHISGLDNFTRPQRLNRIKPVPLAMGRIIDREKNELNV